MSPSTWSSKSLILLAIAGLVLSPLKADGQSPIATSTPPSPRDVELTANGDLRGTVRNPAGQPEANVLVEIRHQHKVVSQAVSEIPFLPGRDYLKFDQKFYIFRRNE